MSKNSEDPLRKELEGIIDTLITDVTNYVDRANAGNYPILFVGKFRERALNGLLATVMLRSEHRKRISNLKSVEAKDGE